MARDLFAEAGINRSRDLFSEAGIKPPERPVASTPTPAPRPQQPTTAEKPEEQPSYLGELGRGLVRGLGTVVGGGERVLEELPDILRFANPFSPTAIAQDFLRPEARQAQAQAWKQVVSPASSAIGAGGKAITESVAPRAEKTFQESTGLLGGLRALGVSAAESAVPTIASIGTGLLTKSPGAAMAMMGATGVPQTYSGIRDTQEQEGIDDIRRAVAGTTASAAFDLLTGSGGAITRTTKELGQSAIKQTLMKAAKEVGRTITEEGATEMLQNVIEQVAGGADPTTKQSMFDTLEAGLVGMLMGGVTSATMETAKTGAELAQQRRARIDAQAKAEAAASITPEDVESPLDTADIAAGRETVIKGDLEKTVPKPSPAAPVGLTLKKPVPEAANAFDKMVQITLHAESRGRRYDKNGNVLTSPAGAKGEMQVMDGTNTDPGFGVRPAQNNSLEERARVGRDYIAAMLRRYGNDPAKAWAAYNAGPGRVDNAIKQHGEAWLDNMPAETRKYVMGNLSRLGSFDVEGNVAPVDMAGLNIETEDALSFAQRVLGEDFLSSRTAPIEPTQVEVPTAPGEAPNLEAVQNSLAGDVLPEAATTPETTTQAASELPAARALASETGGGVNIARAGQGVESATVTGQPVTTAPAIAPQAEAVPTQASSVRVEPTESGKGMAIIDATPEELAAIQEALPEKAQGMTRRSDGATVYSKKYEEKIRNALDAHAKLKAATLADGTPLDDAARAARRAEAERLEVKGERINDEWSRFNDTSGTLAVPRAEMPQIKAEHRGAMVNFMNARGIAHRETTVPATALKPTQDEFSPGKVQQAKDYGGGDRAILVSNDGHILDGHHQWLAARENGETVRAIELDAPIRELIDRAHEFPSSTTDEGSNAGQEAEPRETAAPRAPERETARSDQEPVKKETRPRGPVSQMPGRRTNKEYQMQGDNARLAGWDESDNPYYASSTAGEQWAKGWRDRDGMERVKTENLRSTDPTDKEFQKVWMSKDFRAAIKELGDLPHRESEVAASMVRGWIDGKTENLEALTAEYNDLSARSDAFQPNGFNPRQGYIEAFYAAVMGESKEVRAVGDVHGNVIPASVAVARIDIRLNPEAQDELAEETPTPAPAAPSSAKPARRMPKSNAKPLSLIEWIAARGGIWDGNAQGEGFKGGDFKSMGLGQWHLKQPFRKKAIRDPKLGAGNNGPDTLLRDAIDAGYFPELQGRDESTYDNLIDTQDLYDAIEAELRGRPRYSTYDQARLEGARDTGENRPMDQEELETARAWLAEAAENIGIERAELDNDFLDYAAQLHWDARGQMSEADAVLQAIDDYASMNREEAVADIPETEYDGDYVDPFAPEYFGAGNGPEATTANRARQPLVSDNAASGGSRGGIAGEVDSLPAEARGQEAPALDRGEAVNPAIAERQRQEAQLRAEAPLRGENTTGQAQDGTMGLGLFDQADQPQMDLSPRSVRRPTDKKNLNPYVRNGERYTLSRDIDYLSAGETYEVSGAGKKSAAFTNVRDGGRSTLNNFDIERALRDGGMTLAVEPVSETDELPAPTTEPVVEESGGGGERTAYGSANKLFTSDAAERARAVLRAKQNQLNAGFDPEIAQAGLTLMGYHIEAGARSFIDAARAVASDLGMTPAQLRNSLRSWYTSARIWMEDNGGDVRGMDDDATVKVDLARIEQWGGEQVAEQPTPTQETAPATTPALERLSPLSQAFAREFVAGRSFDTITEARRFAKETIGQDYAAGTPEAKVLDEAIEAATVYAARQIATRNEGNPSAAYDALVNLYQRQPKLTVRTSTSVAQQAYSTPAPLAYLASQLAGIDQTTTVYEPSAGNGMLLIDARATYATANELNPERAAQLRTLYPGATITENDATTFDPGEQFDAIIANPPFGAVKDDTGQGVVFDVDGQYSTREIDHAIAMKALDAMRDDGRAVLIVGGLNKQIVDPQKRADAYNGKAKREFYYSLYTQYNVIDHFTVDGSLYERQGAGWPVDVIVIDGRGRSSLSLPAVKAPRQYGDWAALKEAMNGRGQQGIGAVRQPDVRNPERDARSETVDEGNLRERGERGLAGRERSGAVDERGPVRGGPAAGESAGVRVGAGREGVAGPAENQQPARPAGRPATVAEESEDGRQVSYTPGSRAAPMGTLVPVNMGSAIDDALADLQQRRGDIDTFVADRLGYAPDELSDYFGAEQVDSLALAIDNMENGAGFILGSQTGIGKGRVVAGVIRYAMRQGRNPIFVTEKPNLYRDMYRDMQDIGIPAMLGRDLNIVMTNTSEKVPLNEEGTEVLSSAAPAKHNALLERLATGGNLAAEGVDVLFTTYAQMQTVKGQETLRQRAIERLATGGIVIMDESHNAGGQSTGFEPKNAPRSRAKFARDIVNRAHGVVYSSATYAKRPDVMDLYSATDMKLAVPDIEKLGEVISKGGVPMQQVVAAMLAKAGQYVRHERSFEGIAYNTPSVDIDVEKYARCCEILKAIQDFSEIDVKLATEYVDQQVRSEGKTIGADNATGGAGAHSTNFTSIMHNAIDQMLLAFKAGAAADRAIDAIRAGQRPVITVANTLESFLTQVAEDSSKSAGSEFEVSFGDVFRRYLERARVISIRKPFMPKGAKAEKHRLTDRELGPAGVEAFRDAMEMIDRAGLDDLPGSPIDFMIARIKDAGYQVGEITGRGLGLEYRDGRSFLKVRSQAERSIKGRIQTIERFNNGDIDAIILNRSGSTGLSLHASERFRDQRQRKMIIAQAEGNIDTHMQMLGRIHRTGQVVLPEYDQLVGGVPAEKRPATVLAKKMASLNANTTAARDSALTSTEVLDFMNEYGDEVAARLMEDNPDIHHALGEPLNAEEDRYVRDGAARKVTGRIPLLPVNQQEELYEQLEEEYRALLAQKDAAGENALEAKTFDLDAESLERKEAVPPANSNSPFADGVYVETMDVKSPIKPFTTGQVQDMIDANRADIPDTAKAVEAGRAYAREAIELTKDDKARERTRERMIGDLQQYQQIRAAAALGTPLRLKTDIGNYYGVVTNITRNAKTKNPVALGSWKLEVALVNGNARSIILPFSQIAVTGEPALDTIVIEKADKIGDMTVMEAFDRSQTNLREKRSIVTGNLLAGFDYVDGKGTIINFTTADGGVRQGIMLQRGFNFERHHAARPIVMPDAGSILALLDQFPTQPMTGQGGTGQIAVATVPNGQFIFTTARSKAAGGEFFTNTSLTDALGRDFTSTSTGMVARVDREHAQTALTTLIEGGVKFEVGRKAPDGVKDAARALTEQARGRQSRIEPGYPPARPAEQPTDRAALASELEAQLRKMVPADKVTLKVVDLLFANTGNGKESIGGDYLDAVIRVAAEADTDGRYTIDHEAVHALKDLGMFKAEEWRALERAAREDKALMGRIGKLYSDLDAVGQAEEAVAEMFAAWRANKRQASGFIRDAFRRVEQFFDAVRRAFAKTPSARDVMRQIERGDIGQREPTQGAQFFDDANPEVNPTAKQQRTVAEELFLSSDKPRWRELVDEWRTRLQDKMLPLLRIQDRIQRQTGRALPEALNPYLQEELMTGRVGAEIEHFTDEYVNPLFAAMEVEGVTVDELETYLYARHAPERNARIASINPEFEEGTGSGMSDAEATAIMEQVEASGKREALERLAEKVDAMLAYAVDRRVESGLLSEEEADAWRETYQYYVPLRGEAELQPEQATDRPRFGSGNTVRGPESKRAFGRRSRARDILAYAIMQGEEAIMRAGRNEVAKSFYNLARQSPDSDFWQVAKVTRKPVFNKATGTVSYRNESRVQSEDEPYTITAKIDGQERRVTLNRHNPEAVRLAEAMRNLNGVQMGQIIELLSRMNRYLSTVNTALNPEFVITNALRDIQTASINLTATDRKGIVRGVMSDYLKALGAMTRSTFDKESKAKHAEWDRWAREFQDEGGRVYFNKMEDINAIRKRVEATVARMNAEPNSTEMAKRVGREIFGFIDNANLAVENAIRLSAYKNARERGMSKAEAASLAKNLTVNFNRRGGWGVAMNSLYLFYNASVQGSFRIITALQNKSVRRVAYGMIALGFALELLNMMLSGTDDDGEKYYDKISSFDKGRNLIIMTGDSSYLKFPMPYGYNVFPAIGRATAEIYRGKRWQDSGAALASTIIDAFNPIGGTESLLNLISPTFADPLIDLYADNRDFAGRPIVPEQNPYETPEPDSQKYWATTNPVWQKTAEILNSITGGDDVVPGMVDVSPETLSYMFDYVTGAAGTFFADRVLGTGTKLLNGEAIEANDLPLVRKVVGGKPGWYDKAAFYSRASEIETAADRLKKYEENENDEVAASFEDKNAELLDLVGDVKDAKKALRSIRKDRAQIDLDEKLGQIDAATAREERRLLKQDEQEVITDFNTIYMASVSKPKGPD